MYLRRSSVARVTNFDRREGLQFAEIKAQPLATLDRLKYMLLLWLPDSDQETIEEIRAVSENSADVQQSVKEKTIQKSIPTQNDKSLVTGGSGNNKESVGDNHDH